MSESRREQTLSVGLSQIREEISRASQSSLSAIQHSSQQSQLAWREIEALQKSEAATVAQLRRELTRTNEALVERGRELAVVGAERDSLRAGLQSRESEAVKQEEVL